MDLRVRVLEYLARGYTQSEASQVFGVGRETIYNWLCLKEKSESVAMRWRGHRQPSKFEETQLREYVAAHLDDHLSEIASFFKRSASGAYRCSQAFKNYTKKVTAAQADLIEIAHTLWQIVCVKG